MKIVHISTSDSGGAAISCIRLHIALLEAGIDSHLVTNSKKRKDIPNHHVFSKAAKISLLEKIKIRFGLSLPLYQKHQKYLANKIEGFEHFSFPESEFDLTDCELIKEADVINLHWVAGFLDYPEFFKNSKQTIVLTLHDMNAFTGGCHYSNGCEKYRNSCELCPQLAGTISTDSSRINLLIKQKSTRNVNLTIVTPSKWLAECAKSSALLKNNSIHIIPYSLNLQIFKPIDKLQARLQLGLPADKKIILFVSSSLDNKRKGLDLLIRSLSLLKNTNEYILCSVGQNSFSENSMNHISLGEMKEEKQMALAYNAADVFVLPATEDNLPNVALESVACGVPVIAFNIGGLPDIVKHGFNGLLCPEINPLELAETINSFFGGAFVFDKMKIRQDAEERFNNTLQANTYISLYKKLLKNK